jgi:hypothetical protein
VTDIPVLVPPTVAELAVPYLTPAQFQAYPTWLDLDNLVPGGAAAIQEDALADVLLAASVWAVGEVENMPLHGHYVQGENLRTRAGIGGRLYFKPRHIPVRAITALTWGFDPTMMQADTLPDPTMWIEEGREVSFLPGGGIVQFTGPALQFGPVTRPGMRAYINWSYVAGFPSTSMPAGVASGAESVQVADPTSVLPGDVLRIYDVGKSEALTVAATYTPVVPTIPPTPTSIPLAAAAQFAHADGVGITGMPRRILQAVYAYGVALLMRVDVSEDEPVSAFGPAARTVESGSSTAGKAGGLVNDARGWLSSYRPTLRP